MKNTRVTRKHVAEMAGVSPSVVSYVINKGPRPVSQETRARVEKVIDELGYYPNELARSLRSSKTLSIGLIIPNINNPVYAEIASSIEGICRQEGYIVLLCNSGRDPAQEKKFIEILRAKQVDGVIMTPTQNPMELANTLQQARIPVVLLEHDLPGVHCIAIDDFRGGQLAAEHLIDLGHRSIGYIRRSPSSACSSQRIVGYRNALETAGIPFNRQLVVEAEAGQEAGFQAMQRLLALPEPPTAVLTHNDILAIGAMKAVRKAGLSIPEDISIVGYDDISSANYLTPPLTTIRFPKYELGSLAAQMILQLAQYKEDWPIKREVLPVELVIRGTTAPPKNT
jgi:LacI family transcriptional regulator